MIRQAIAFLRFAISMALAVGIVLSSDAQSKSHDLVKVAEIMAAHQAEIEDHGHAHDDIVDVLHVFKGHAHEMVDQDHNTAFLPPRRGVGFLTPVRTNWPLKETAMADRRATGLDRPPRA